MQLHQGAALFGDDQQARGIAVEPVRKLQHLRLRRAARRDSITP